MELYSYETDPALYNFSSLRPGSITFIVHNQRNLRMELQMYNYANPAYFYE